MNADEIKLIEDFKAFHAFMYAEALVMPSSGFQSDGKGNLAEYRNGVYRIVPRESLE